MMSSKDAGSMGADVSSSPHRSDSTSRPRRSRARRWVRRILFLAYFVVILELGARAFWTVRYGVPYMRMRDIWSYRFYPELNESRVNRTQITKSDGYYDVLILGGSVISPSFGDIGQLLGSELHEITGLPARVFNCAFAAHSSRDSLLKYRKLAEQRFDLVVVYHAINDARLNNCPRSRFREDYSHSAWYYRVQALDKHPELRWFVLPYTIEHAVVGALDSKSIGWFLPKHNPNHWDWTREGLDVKTAPCFRRNMTEIVELARQRDAKVLLMGYAWHIPEDYSIERFRAKALSYGKHSMPIEAIGRPEGVRRTCELHNRIVAEIAERYDHVLYVDQDRLMPKQAEFFDDVCHLTQNGCKRFVTNLHGPLTQWYAAETRAHENVAERQQGRTDTR